MSKKIIRFLPMLGYLAATTVLWTLEVKITDWQLWAIVVAIGWVDITSFIRALKA